MVPPNRLNRELGVSANPPTGRQTDRPTRDFEKIIFSRLTCDLERDGQKQEKTKTSGEKIREELKAKAAERTREYFVVIVTGLMNFC